MTRLQDQLAAARAAAKSDAGRLRDDLDRAEVDVSDLRRKLHEARQQAKDAAAAARVAEEDADAARAGVESVAEHRRCISRSVLDAPEPLRVLGSPAPGLPWLALWSDVDLTIRSYGRVIP